MAFFSFIKNEGTVFGEERARPELGEHYCILTATSDCGMFHLKPNANIWQRICRMLRKFTFPTYYHRKCRIYYPSRKSLVSEWRKVASTRNPCIIHPFSRFTLIKEMIMCVVWTISAFCRPFYAVLYIQQSEMQVILRYIIFTISAIYMLYIASNFVTGVQLSWSRKLIVLDARYICKRYLLTYFIFDLLEALPLTMLYLQFGGNDLVIFCRLSALHFAQFLRFGTFLKYLGDTLVFMRLNYNKHLLIICIVIGMLIMHWCACFLIFWPPFSHYIVNSGDSNYEIMRSEETIFIIYVTALQRVITHLFSAGINAEYSDVFPLIITFLIGVFFRIYLLSLVIFAVLRYDKSETECEVFMEETARYLESENLSLNIKQRVELFLRNKYGSRYTNIKKIERYLSENLQHEIFLHSCTHLVENLNLFRNLNTPQLNDLLIGLEPTLFLAGDIVARFSDEENDLYLISYGKLAFYTAQGREVMHIQDGAIAGLSGFIEGTQQWTIAAIETTNAFLWRRNDVAKFTEKYPALYNKMRLILKKVQNQFNETMSEKKTKNTLDDDTLCVKIQLRHQKIVEHAKKNTYWNREFITTESSHTSY